MADEWGDDDRGSFTSFESDPPAPAATGTGIAFGPRTPLLGNAAVAPPGRAARVRTTVAATGAGLRFRLYRAWRRLVESALDAGGSDSSEQRAPVQPLRFRTPVGARTAAAASGKEIQSLDYLPQNSALYREWLSQHAHLHHRRWDRWAVVACIGLAMGVVGFLMYLCIDVLSSIRVVGARSIAQSAGLLPAWAYSVGVSAAMALVASHVVVRYAPESAGPGVPEIMAYLNGCALPRILSVRTFAAKFLSATLAVGSGLPVGPEGPMIHLGAIMGGGISQGYSRTLNFDTRLFQRFRNNRDRRDFVTAGVAVGVAAAFGAPVGGLLFAMEEVASFWTATLSWEIMLACTLAVLAMGLMESIQESLFEEGGHFGLLDRSYTDLFEVKQVINAHVAAVVPAAVIGLLCGALAAAFTRMILRAAAWRKRAVAALQQPDTWRKLEPAVLAAVFATLAACLPLLFACVEAPCRVDPTPTPAGAASRFDCPLAPSNVTEPDWKPSRVVDAYVSAYGCPAANVTGNNGTAPIVYNEMSTLMRGTGEETILRLFSRNTHREVGYLPLATMLAVYLLAAAWAAGAAISTGLFVPMMLIGALVGRLTGLAAVDLIASLHGGSPGAPPGVFLDPSPWSWIDPGAMALVGAGAFMSGVTRLTVSLVVITVELSGDLHFLVPLLTSVMVAKAAADALQPSALYHAQLEARNVPFLGDPDACVKDASALGGGMHSLDLVPVRAAMAHPVATVPEKAPPAALRAVLAACPASGFPVVRANTPTSQVAGGGRVFVGIILRKHLEVLLRSHEEANGGHLQAESYGWGVAPHPPARAATGARELAVLDRPALSVGDHAGSRRQRRKERKRGRKAGADVQMMPLEMDAEKAGLLHHGEDGSDRGGGSSGGRSASPKTPRAGTAPSGGAGGAKAGGSDSATTAGAAGSAGEEAGEGLDWEDAATAEGPEEIWSRRDEGELVDLRRFVDTSAMKVSEDFSLERAYLLFRAMGLRHLTVTDVQNNVIGIITRHDLQPDVLQRAVQHTVTQLF
ncbi:unnamed protein product [Pedinophyceae sp. YPF-701]|nr:unnamed protein product [Pedinophyceae sp. YPF-701]